MDKDNPTYLTDISEVEKSTNESRLIQQFNTKIFMKRRKKFSETSMWSHTLYLSRILLRILNILKRESPKNLYHIMAWTHSPTPTLGNHYLFSVFIDLFILDISYKCGYKIGGFSAWLLLLSTMFEGQSML